MKITIHTATWFYIIPVIIFILFGVFGAYHGNEYSNKVFAQYAATTSVSLTVCGDGLVAPNEFCDDGVNSGAYSSSTAGRNCDPVCEAWGPYCGDTVIQTFYGEECDDGNNDDGDLCDYICQNETDPVIEGGGGSVAPEVVAEEEVETMQFPEQKMMGKSHLKVILT